MGRSYDAIPDHLVEWLPAQPLWFVASAPSGPDGHVNLSPKAGDTFRVLDATTVAYLDLTGSGAETIAHVRQNGRLTIMFCSFDEQPNIVRLYGRGEALLPGHPDVPGLLERFDDHVGTRSLIRLSVEMVTTSCGYSIPLMDVRAPRASLDEWAERRGRDGVADYQAARNQHSIDGLPALG